MRIGIGVDIHRFEPNRSLILGGVTIPYTQGLAGHSDADVLTHAVMDAILGALGLGNIGTHFPDTDAQYKNVNSLYLLDQVSALMRDQAYRINNVDATILCQSPKLNPHIPSMCTTLAKHLDCDSKLVNIKATTGESLGFIGRKEGVCVQCVVLLTACDY